jgi:hypothetical protein
MARGVTPKGIFVSSMAAALIAHIANNAMFSNWLENPVLALRIRKERKALLVGSGKHYGKHRP